MKLPFKFERFDFENCNQLLDWNSVFTAQYNHPRGRNLNVIRIILGFVKSDDDLKKRIYNDQIKSLFHIEKDEKAQNLLDEIDWTGNFNILFRYKFLLDMLLEEAKEINSDAWRIINRFYVYIIEQDIQLSGESLIGFKQLESQIIEDEKKNPYLAGTYCSHKVNKHVYEELTKDVQIKDLNDTNITLEFRREVEKLKQECSLEMKKLPFRDVIYSYQEVAKRYSAKLHELAIQYYGLLKFEYNISYQIESEEARKREAIRDQAWFNITYSQVRISLYEGLLEKEKIEFDINLANCKNINDLDKIKTEGLRLLADAL